MFTNRKKQLIISSILILLPILAGLILWNRLPDTIATHWGPDGAADGWSSKTFAVMGLPLFLLAVHWFGLWLTSSDKHNANQTAKAIQLMLWICPVISILGSSALYCSALGIHLNMVTLPAALMGILFIVIGNYLPKCKHNYTIGIKLPWTLASEENWNATHRFAGKVWVIGGVGFFLLMLIPEEKTFVFTLIIMAILVLIPTVYSYLYSRKEA